MKEGIDEVVRNGFNLLIDERETAIDQKRESIRLLNENQHGSFVERHCFEVKRPCSYPISIRNHFASFDET